MKKMFLAILFAVVCTTVFQSCSSDMEMNGSLYGIVSLSGDSQPVEGVKVELYTVTKQDKSNEDYGYDYDYESESKYSLLLSTVTASDGSYEFTNLAPGDYYWVKVVYMNSAGNGDWRGVDVVVESGRQARADFTINTTYYNSARIWGCVRDTNGSYIDCAVIILEPLGLNDMSYYDGDYGFYNLKAGTYTLHVTKEGYVDYTSDNIRLENGQSLDYTIVLRKD